MKPALKLNVMFAHFPYAGNSGFSSEIPQIRRWELQTVLKMKDDPRIGEFSIQDFSDTPITYTRNKAVKHAKKIGAHVLLMIDSDNDPLRHEHEPWHKPFWDEAFTFIYDRYSKGPHCVFAPYCGPPSGKENVFAFSWHNYGNHGDQTEFSLEQVLREEAQKLTGIQEAAAGATGLILYDMRCFDLIEPYHGSKRSVLEKVASGEMTVNEGLMNLNEGYYYYEWSDCHADEKASTEDVTNTRDISLAGILKLGYNPVHCAWDSWIGHYKPWNVGKPQRYMADQVGHALRKAVLDDIDPREQIAEISMLNRGDDPLSRRLQQMAHESQEQHRRSREASKANGNGKHNGNGHSPVNRIGKLITANDNAPIAIPTEKIKPQWRAWDKSVEFATFIARGRSVDPLVVDIGPGAFPFPAATEFVGRRDPAGNYGDKPFHDLDLNCERLPYADQSVDFVYCRHVLEDLDNPMHLLREIRRVAKAGWLETPSPICETTSGVDAPGALHTGKGFGHHRHLLWSNGSELRLIPKFPILQELKIAERPELLNEGPWYWNTYHIFAGSLQFKQYEHGIDFNVNTDARYEFLVREGCRLGIAASRDIYQAATGEKLPELCWFPWYDSLETPKTHLDFLASRAVGKRVLEVGSFLGRTAMAMADAGAEVHCVDHWRGSPSDPSHLHVIAAGGSDDVYDEFKKRVGSRLDKTIFPWRMSSIEAAGKHWKPFDLIFIDAEHTYEHAKADILAWWKHLRDDGTMLIHDYMTVQFPGVTQAVKELFGDVPGMAECNAGYIAEVKKSDYPNLLSEVSSDAAAVG